MARYAIHEDNVPRLLSKVKRVENKCSKYGCAFHFAEVGEEFRTFTVGRTYTEDGWKDEEETRRFVLFDVEGTAVKNGWRFVATLEHTDKGNIVRSVEGAPEVPRRYYDCAPYCEHCKTRRTRKSSFIVQNEETGEFMQVGKSCLADFTNGLSAEAVASWLSLFEDFATFDGSCGVGGHLRRYYSVETMLCYFVEATRLFGYIPKDGSDPTAWLGLDFWEHDYAPSRLGRKYDFVHEKMLSSGFKADTEQNHVEARECIAWAIEHEDESNYLHNLATICKSECTTASTFGYLASLPNARRKSLEKDAEKKARAERRATEAETSDFVGNVGDRLEVKVADHIVLTSWETAWGTTYLHKFVGEDGNTYTWKSGTVLPDKVSTLKGTVKAHNEFRGVKQTELTRCKAI